MVNVKDNIHSKDIKEN